MGYTFSMILISYYYSLFTSGLLIIVSRLYEILNWELYGIYANEYVKSTTLLHGCFSRFVNRTNGTKLLKAPHMHTEISLMFAVKSRRIASLNCSFLKNVIALRVSWNLLQFKKVIGAKVLYHRTPLMAACIDGHIDVVQLLLAHKADVSLRDAEGKAAKDHAEGNENSM